jgi:hypothetical protein
MKFPNFFKVVLVATLVLSNFVAAQENENSVPLLLGLESSGAELGAIQLTLKGREVTISTELTNTKVTAIKVGWYANTPQFSLLGIGEEHVDKSFSDVRAKFNGKEKKAEVYQRGFFMGRDITEELIRAGLPPLPTLNENPKNLKRLHAVNSMHFDDWQGYANYAWVATLPPGAVAEIQVRYRALPAFALTELDSDEFDHAIGKDCGDAREARQRVKLLSGVVSQVIIERYEMPIIYLRLHDIEVRILQPSVNWLKARPVLSIACGLVNEKYSASIGGLISNANNTVAILVVSVPSSPTAKGIK